MRIQRIEEDIDTLLRYMNQNIEDQGFAIDNAFFAFTEEQGVEHLIGEATWTTKHLKRVIKICINRTLLKYAFEHNHDYFQEVALTSKGQIRAIFAEEDIRLNRKAKAPSGTRVFYQPTKKARREIQLYEPTFSRLIRSIETAAYPVEDRDEATTRVRRLLEYPLVFDITGGIATNLLPELTPPQ